MNKKLIILLSFLPSILWAEQSVTLAWNRNTETFVSGYKVYYGGASRQYTNVLDAGNLTEKRVDGLEEGKKYFFAATAYTTNGVESDYSLEVSYSNVSPVLSKFGDITTFSNQKIPPVAFTVTDKETESWRLVVRAYSSNTSAVQRTSLVLTGTLTNRMLHFSTNSVPFGAQGSTIITVALSDPWCTVTQQFNLNLIASPGTPKGLNTQTIAQ